MHHLIACSLLLIATSAVAGQNPPSPGGFGWVNRIDVVTPAAPELAAYGPHAVGVRTLAATDRDRPDILNTKAGGPTARYDRTLTLEVWYPAALAAGQSPGGEYRVLTRNPKVQVTLTGRAVRDAAPLRPAAVSARDHLARLSRQPVSAEPPRREPGEQGLRHRLDRSHRQHLRRPAGVRQHALQPAARSVVRPARNRASRRGVAGSFLAGLVDTARTGIVGYSMGGYGVINTIGGGYSAAGVTSSAAPPNGLLAERGAGNPEYAKTIDPRIKAAVAIGPWGMQAGSWDAEGLAGIRTPMLFVAGSADEVSGYERGTRALFHGDGQRRSLSAHVRQRRPQRRGALSGAGGGDGPATARRHRRSRTTPIRCGTRRG